MTNPEPNPRLNVPIKLVASPTGDFAIAGADGAHGAAAVGAAIRVGDTVETSAGAVAAVSHLQNLSVPAGGIAATSAAGVAATSDLSFSAPPPRQTGGALSISAPNLSPTEGAGLSLSPPKFTY